MLPTPWPNRQQEEERLESLEEFIELLKCIRSSTFKDEQLFQVEVLGHYQQNKGKYRRLNDDMVRDYLDGQITKRAYDGKSSIDRDEVVEACQRSFRRLSRDFDYQF